MLSTTPVTPVAGTPPTPATWSWRIPWGPTAVPARVSRMRAGFTGTYVDPPAAVSEYQPWTSATTSTVPRSL